MQLHAMTTMASIGHRDVKPWDEHFLVWIPTQTVHCFLDGQRLKIGKWTVFSTGQSSSPQDFGLKMQQAIMYQASELCGVTHCSTYTFNFFDSQDPLYLEDHSPSYLFSLRLGTGMLDLDLSGPAFSISGQWGSGIQHYILGCGLMGKGKKKGNWEIDEEMKTVKLYIRSISCGRDKCAHTYSLRGKL